MIRRRRNEEEIVNIREYNYAKQKLMRVTCFGYCTALYGHPFSCVNMSGTSHITTEIKS